MIPPRPLTPEEQEFIADMGWFDNPRPLNSFREKPKAWLWVLLGAGIGWLLIGFLVLAITGLMMAVAP
jgi:hypothetical protein